MWPTPKQRSLSWLFRVDFPNNKRATEGHECEINMIIFKIQKDHPVNSVKTFMNEPGQKLEDQVGHSGSHKIQSGCQPNNSTPRYTPKKNENVFMLVHECS